MSKPWERRKKESEQAYEALKAYLDMGDKRSLAKVGEQLGKSTALMERWSRRWDWKNRSVEYDNELARAEMEAKVAAIEEMVSRHAMTGRLMQKKAYEALKDLDPSMIPVRLIPQFIIEGARLEREATLYGIEDGSMDEETADGLVIINDTRDADQ